MSMIETLHNQAMNLAEEAFIAQRHGDREKSISLKNSQRTDLGWEMT